MEQNLLVAMGEFKFVLQSARITVDRLLKNDSILLTLERIPETLKNEKFVCRLFSFTGFLVFPFVAFDMRAFVLVTKRKGPRNFPLYVENGNTNQSELAENTA